MRKARLSRPARKFIAIKIRKNMNEGYNRRKAIEIAYSQARKVGYRIPPRRRMK